MRKLSITKRKLYLINFSTVINVRNNTGLVSKWRSQRDVDYNDRSRSLLLNLKNCVRSRDINKTNDRGNLFTTSTY